MHIRNLTMKDYPVFDRCMQQLHALHVESRPDLYAPLEHPCSEEDLRQIIEGDSIAIAAVNDSNELMGFCIARYKHRSNMVKLKTAYVDDMFVLPEYRRQGVAKRLYEEMKAIAKAAGAARIDLMVWEFNESALAFYQSLGMSPQRYIMEQRL